ncbi:MAG: Gfo/Idh/MocA family oxidoreductase [Mesorhizobium sp.]|uniref:Gfo/Idh/MocA family protein n=1 Tax=Mesorhizobium sp. TaxID=1871066 RepID=UPI000FE8BC4C|nr:Gfo/Idh/MocA family oxidoreductase [Mesorhizobium sp.]RWE06399.1 MAG: Gfo/Idh/MocA family oxidoreductase [Mesorhizobium sp.]RWP15731.1 MAG: Gfo/Idh/MocA family oxidoreductase [Mesorhizobium sp.]
MNAELRWGILATGWIADLFVQDLQLAGHRVSAVGSRTQAGADKFANRFSIPNAHASYQDLLSDPEVDIIYVATPHPMHADNAVKALTAGKHVLIEKPFTINAREARKVVDLASTKNLVVMEGMWTRFLPHMVRIREIIASGVLGTIYSVIADHTRDLPGDPNHRLNALELGGGALLDLAIYPISFAFDVLGEPEHIVSMARIKETGVDAEVATIFRHAGGAMSTTISSLDNTGPNVASILGTEGRVEIASTWYSPTSFRHIAKNDRVIEEYSSSVAGRGMQYEAAEMERLVTAGKLSGEIMPAKETVSIMQSLDTIRAQIGLRYPNE